MSKEVIEIDQSNINSYYKKVNDAVDAYFNDHKVRPSSLKRFLKPKSKGIEKFIEMNDFKNVKNIEMIIRDVVDDRYSMEQDGVLTFESFHEINENFNNKVNEIDQLKSILQKPDSPIKFEKVIADKYNVSLGHVEEFDLDKHEYNVEIPGHENIDVFILNDEDLALFTGELITMSYGDFIKNDIKYFNTNVDDVITLDDFYNKLAGGENEIENTLTVLDKLLAQEQYKSHEEYKGYYIWER